MSEVLIKAAQLILSLSILVILHELGHFLPAIWFKTRVEKFYLFFDPYFSLFKVKFKGTEYGIGWVPLGGYVKIAGMIDESNDKDFLNREPQPWEFRSKPAWQRLIIMLGGVTVNAILGIIIYSAIMFYYGEMYLPAKNLKYGIMTDTLGYEIGLKNGDQILSVGNKPIETLSDVGREILLNDAASIEVARGMERIVIPVDEEFQAKLLRSPGFLTPRFPFTIYDFAENSAAKKAGLKIDDRVVAINGNRTFFYDEVRNSLATNKGRQIQVTVQRGNKLENLSVNVPETGLLGVMPATYDKYFAFEVKTYSLLQSIPKGFEKASSTFSNYLKQFKLIFSPTVKGYESVGGFMRMGSIFAPTWDWEHFWNITAFLSVVLAIMNLLPIPALDGGHVVFLLYEMITRRKPNEKVLEYAQYAGMFILLSLMLYANGNDIYTYFINKM